jgi:hypothetical protein
MLEGLGMNFDMLFEWFFGPHPPMGPDTYMLWQFTAWAFKWLRWILTDWENPNLKNHRWHIVGPWLSAGLVLWAVYGWPTLSNWIIFIFCFLSGWFWHASAGIFVWQITPMMFIWVPRDSAVQPWNDYVLSKRNWLLDEERNMALYWAPNHFNMWLHMHVFLAVNFVIWLFVVSLMIRHIPVIVLVLIRQYHFEVGLIKAGDYSLIHLWMSQASLGLILWIGYYRLGLQNLVAGLRRWLS